MTAIFQDPVNKNVVNASTLASPEMQSQNPNRVVVGLSGGVDSSVAAHLLLEQGHEVSALFMKNWEEDDNGNFCAAAEDLADAEEVCKRLGIELRTVNFSSEYWDNVFRRFIDELEQGKTPNPDVMCNRHVKFDAFWQAAKGDSADYISTGHYARKGNPEEILMGTDQNKDQTYFLSNLNQAQMQRALFPIGHLQKGEVRHLASDFKLPAATRKDSQGICFLGKIKFSEPRFRRKLVTKSTNNVLRIKIKCPFVF